MDMEGWQSRLTQSVASSVRCLGATADCFAAVFFIECLGVALWNYEAGEPESAYWVARTVECEVITTISSIGSYESRPQCSRGQERDDE